MPSVVYLGAFALLTFPTLARFSTRFICDGGDGLQNVWNLWWVGWAVRARQNPWFTYHLHYPGGTSLVAHTLVPFDGLIALPLRHFLTLVQAHNAIVVFSFVMGGVTAFWRSLGLTGRYGGSLVAGGIFTFSSYHFAHAEGHLQLVSLEWIPLFLLAWCSLLERPTLWRGAGAAGALLLVLLCDYYYFAFSLLAAAIVLLCELASAEAGASSRRGALFRGLVVFGVVAVVGCGPLVIALLRLAMRDPLLGAHDPRVFSMDLLAPLIPGGHWRFHSCTQFFWGRLPGNIHESSVHWGLSAIVLAVVGWRWRRQLGCRHHSTVLGLLATFALFALGPRLQVLGRPLGHVRGPFAALEIVVPVLRLAGCPVRMSVMVFAALGILAGLGFAALWDSGSTRRVWAVCLLVLLVVEYWPKPLPDTDPAVPELVTAMAALPKDGGMLDVQRAIPDTAALYYQTIHEIPQTHGYIARMPRSVRRATVAIDRLAEAREWQTLCEQYGIRYLVFREGEKPGGSLADAQPILRGAGLSLFDAGVRWRCSRGSVAPVL